MLEALLIVIAVAVIAGGSAVVATRRHLARLRRERRQRLDDLRAEHHKRVDRLQRKYEDSQKHGHLEFAADLLPAVDALGMALDQSDANADMAAVREGLEMVARELGDTLAAHDIEVCRPEPGDSFDPEVHEAVSIDHTDNCESGTVVECFRPGYVHHGRVIRPAAVAIARPTDARAHPRRPAPDESTAPDATDGASPPSHPAASTADDRDCPDEVENASPSDDDSSSRL